MRSFASFLACSAHLACWRSYFVGLQNEGTFTELGMLLTCCVQYIFWTKLQAEAALLCGEVPVGCVIVKRGASAAVAAAAAAAVTASSKASLSSADSSSNSLPCPAINATGSADPDATAAAAAGTADVGIYANDVVAAGHNETNLTRNVRAYHQCSFITNCDPRSVRD
jgi:hypothetical protein